MIDRMQEMLEAFRSPFEMVRFQLRAKVLLEIYHDRLTEDERTEIARIARAPHADDREFLGGFDRLMD